MTSKLQLNPWEKINSLGDCCVFDTETNGLMPWVKKMHCAVIIDLGTLEEFRYRPGEHQEFLKKLSTYKVAIGHNICAFDFKVLKKLFSFLYSGWKFDTLVLSRLINPERPQGHSLGSWGQALNFRKAVFGETTDWKEYSEEMLEYCAQDVRLNAVLFLYIIRNLHWYGVFKMSLEDTKRLEKQIRAHDLRIVYAKSRSNR